MAPNFPRVVTLVASAFLAKAIVCAPTKAVAQETILEVSVSTAQMQSQASYSLLDLDSIPQTTILTENDFIDGTKMFTGPLVRDLLQGATPETASQVILIAVNDYQVEVPIEDFFDYDVILATRMAGALLSVRDKGPIWVVYPMSEHPELRDNIYNSRLIWQLRRLEVE